MSIHKNSPTFLQDFSGRRVVAAAIIVAIVGSACLNIYGAAMIFPSLITASIFAVVIGANEVIAALTLRHIIADRENNRTGKAALASLMLALAITGCVISGHKAFSTLFLEANAKHESLQIRAKAAQAIADEYQIILTADDSDMNRSRWERRQETADAAKLLEMKSKPPSEAIIYILLALFELVKIGGLYAIATPSSKGLTARQQRAKKRLEKIKDAQAEAEFERKLAAAIEQEDDANVVPLRAKN
jgi:hypothetical protein